MHAWFGYHHEMSRSFANPRLFGLSWFSKCCRRGDQHSYEISWCRWTWELRGKMVDFDLSARHALESSAVATQGDLELSNAPSIVPTPSTDIFSTLRSPPIPRILPSPGPPCTSIVSGNSRCRPSFHFRKPKPSCTLRLANHAPLPSLPPSLYTDMPRGFSLAPNLMGLLHSFCSVVLLGSMGSERAEEADRSEAQETLEEAVFDLERAGADGSSGGGGTESMMIWAWVNRC